MIETIIRNFTLKSRSKIMDYIDNQEDIKANGYIWFFKLVSMKYMDAKGYIKVDFTNYNSIIANMKNLVEYMEEVFTLDDIDYDLTKIDMESDKGIIAELIQLPNEYFSEIEIIGWIYQYYRSVKKDEVLKLVKKNNKVEKENIGAVTQLFTPKWVVKYMVENSVGRIYLEGRDNDKFKASLRYYVDNEKIKDRCIESEYLKILDPAMGTGHILVYVFDILYEMYQMEGYKKDDIAITILKENIFGFDIDIYSEKLTKFSLYMKAREKDKDIFKKDIHFNIFSFKETSDIEINHPNINKRAREDIEYIVDIFKDAKNLGSIIKVEKDIDFENLYREVEEENLLEIIKQVEFLCGKYHVLITNPPYMGKKNMNKDLAKYINENYPLTKNDLFSVFMEIKDKLLYDDGIVSMITPHSWMFLSSFAGYRADLSKNHTITSLLHLGSRAFNASDVGTIVQAVAYIMENQKVKGYQGSYYNLVDYGNSDLKEKAFLSGKDEYIIDIDELSKIDQHPFAYWINKSMIMDMDKHVELGDLYTVKQGMTTSNNKRFLRFWHEVDREKIGFNMKDSQEAKDSGKKWFPYNKGGTFKKWYGNNDMIVNYENNGEEMIEYTSKLPQGSWVRIKSREYYFKEAVSWPYITDINNFGPRYVETGFIFDVAGPSIFIDGDDKYYIMGILSSPISREVIRVINPTMNFQVENIKRIPIVFDDKEKPTIIKLVKENIKLSKIDYDLFEKSWNFKEHPLLKYNPKLELGISEYCDDINKRFNKVKKNEEKINLLINKIYDLEDEISPKVEEASVTMTRVVDKKIDGDNSYVMTRTEIIENLLGYLVGCILGRYRLDNYDSYDNIIIFNKLDERPDVVFSIKELLNLLFGPENFEENYSYIASIISKDEVKTDDEKIRDYFMYKSGFYNEHNRKFQGNPIYFLFESGKKNAMKGIFSIHRYCGKELVDIANIYGDKLEQIYLKKVESDIDKKENLAKLKELESYRELLLLQDIEVNLDDGIKSNYGKFQDIRYNNKTSNILTKIKL